jgi:hypothetical protein
VKVKEIIEDEGTPHHLFSTEGNSRKTQAQLSERKDAISIELFKTLETGSRPSVGTGSKDSRKPVAALYNLGIKGDINGKSPTGKKNKLTAGIQNSAARPGSKMKMNASKISAIASNSKVSAKGNASNKKSNTRIEKVLSPS